MSNNLKLLSAISLLALFGVSTGSSRTGLAIGSQPDASGIEGLLPKQLASDMHGKNEGRPHGIPDSYDWAQGPVTVMGNDSHGWKAITAWGAIHEAAEGNPARNTRVNIRNMQCLWLRISNPDWIVLQHTDDIDGAAYIEDYSGNANRPADIRRELDGTISVTAGHGYNFHFYPRKRASIEPLEIGGLLTLFEARLIVDKKDRQDDRSSARYLASSGADYYPALFGPWPGSLSFNPGVAGGKLKYVRSEWRYFVMTTLTADELTRNPPPIHVSIAQ